MIRFFKRLFCRHDFNLKILVTTKYASSGDRYRIYKYVCSKCGKEEYRKEWWY